MSKQGLFAPLHAPNQTLSRVNVPLPKGNLNRVKCSRIRSGTRGFPPFRREKPPVRGVANGRFSCFQNLGWRIQAQAALSSAAAAGRLEKEPGGCGVGP